MESKEGSAARRPGLVSNPFAEECEEVNEAVAVFPLANNSEELSMDAGGAGCSERWNGESNR